jgi:hypothetical protein
VPRAVKTIPRTTDVIKIVAALMAGCIVEVTTLRFLQDTFGDREKVIIYKQMLMGFAGTITGSEAESYKSIGSVTWIHFTGNGSPEVIKAAKISEH